MEYLIVALVAVAFLIVLLQAAQQRLQAYLPYIVGIALLLLMARFTPELLIPLLMMVFILAVIWRMIRRLFR